MVPFFLSLGGNLGDRLQYLRQAVDMLRHSDRVDIHDVSSIYETEPVGYMEQPPFLNVIVKGATSFSPRHLLDYILQVEQQLGRKREIRWGPRTIDIDILLYGSQIVREDDLVIPHPRMDERAFVLIPLAEIAGDYSIPKENGSFITPTELLTKVEDKSGVEKWMDIDWETESEHFEN